jgi:hypothetical protein
VTQSILHDAAAEEQVEYPLFSSMSQLGFDHDLTQTRSDEQLGIQQ